MFPIIASIIVFIILSIFWVIQFKSLMRMDSEEFTDQNDKLIWAMAFIFLNFFGAFLFYFIITDQKNNISHNSYSSFTEEDYRKAIEENPEYSSYISEALNLALYKRVVLEKKFKYYDDKKLQHEYVNGKYNLSKSAFGVLITTMNNKQIIKS